MKTKLITFLMCMLFMCPVYADMMTGDRGNDVLAVQKKLAAEGYSVGQLDGVYGEQMEAAVKKYQRDNKIAESGTVDEYMHMMLMSSTLPDRFAGIGDISFVRRLVSSAMSLQNVPYVFGGTSPYGFDCSGFVQYVFRQAGISIPRMADEQYYASRKLESPRLGDLVFFSTYTPGVSHVGIYLGDNQFIHASSSRGVTVSSLGESYWKSCYVGSGRVTRG